MPEEERLQKETFLYECIGKINKFIARRTVKISNQELTGLVSVFRELDNICSLYEEYNYVPVNIAYGKL